MNYEYVLITFTGSKIFLTEEENNRFINLSLDQSVVIGKHRIKGSNIAEITPIDKYYQDHPQDRPEPSYKQLETPKEKPMNKERYLNASRSTLKGLRQYIDEAEKPTKVALELAKKLAQKIKDIKADKIEFPTKQKELINQLT